MKEGSDRLRVSDGGGGKSEIRGSLWFPNILTGKFKVYRDI